MPELDDELEGVVKALRALPPTDPGARARLSDALRREQAARIAAVRPMPGVRGALHWWWPVGLAAAAGLAGFAVRGWIAGPAAPAAARATPAAVRELSPTTFRNAAAGAAHAGRVVQFTLVAPGVSTVAVAGDFSDWAQMPMRRAAGSDVWTATVPLTPGRHTYAFVVDGHEWRADPQAPRASADEFGTPKSIVLIGGGDG